MSWDNAGVRQSLLRAHTMSLGTGLSVPQLCSLSGIDVMLRLKFQQDTGSGSSVHIFRISLRLLSALVPETLGKSSCISLTLIKFCCVGSEFFFIVTSDGMFPLAYTHLRFNSEAVGGSFDLICMDWKWGKNGFPKYVMVLLCLEKVNQCCVARRSAMHLLYPSCKATLLYFTLRSWA